ncbi:hypothetical protein D515_03974 [Grimontia indica]|uniref:Uncharacterized protein n=1 Tax=Grimontia indica TaxID=1056512 RepID=R1I9I2_9GAMM|nr:hypothetical protein D515_03974 [Grimontia indica]
MPLAVCLAQQRQRISKPSTKLKKRPEDEPGVFVFPLYQSQ